MPCSATLEATCPTPVSANCRQANCHKVRPSWLAICPSLSAIGGSAPRCLSIIAGASGVSPEAISGVVIMLMYHLYTAPR